MASIYNEDGILAKSSRVTKERVYTDVDLTFDARTTTDGDIFRKTDAAAVKQALKTLVLSNRFDKPYRPAYGANLSGLLFELMDEDTGDEILSRIKSTVERYEPRVKLLNIKVTAKPDQYSVGVLIEFRVVSTGIIDILKLTLNSADECDPGYFPAPPIKPFAPNYIQTESGVNILSEGGIGIVVDDGPAT